MIGTKKYRPYFTGPELSEVIIALKAKPSPFRLGIIKYLETFQLKINHGIMSPAHTLEGTKHQRLAADLGIDPVRKDEDSIGTNGFALSAKELHNRWMNDPGSLTPPEIDKVMSYRFQEGMMVPEEEAKYMNELITIKR